MDDDFDTLLPRHDVQPTKAETGRKAVPVVALVALIGFGAVIHAAGSSSASTATTDKVSTANDHGVASYRYTPSYTPPTFSFSTPRYRYTPDYFDESDDTDNYEPDYSYTPSYPSVWDPGTGDVDGWRQPGIGGTGIPDDHGHCHDYRGRFTSC